jgi:hypothetical protein
MEKVKQDAPRGAGEQDVAKEGPAEIAKAARAPNVDLQYGAAVLEIMNQAKRGNRAWLGRARQVRVGNR